MIRKCLFSPQLVNSQLSGFSSGAPTSPTHCPSTTQMLCTTAYTFRSSRAICFNSFYCLLVFFYFRYCLSWWNRTMDYWALLQPQVSVICIWVIWCPLSLREGLHIPWSFEGKNQVSKTKKKETMKKKKPFQALPSLPCRVYWPTQSLSLFLLQEGLWLSDPLPFFIH